ncbi:MAG: hypothetical protein ACO1O6_08965 [Bacteroidota bacterium]
MRVLNLLLFICLTLYSCNSATGEERDTEEKPREVEYPKEISSKISYFPLVENELKLDQGFFKDSTRNHKEHQLEPALVKILAAKLSDDEITGPNAYYLKEYYTIEQAKKNKSYDKFLEKLDIGQTRDANCYALSRIEFGDSIAALLWRLDFSSYEACPFFQGSHYLLSLIYGGKVIQTIQVAADESAADAPVSSTILQEARISARGTLSFSYESSVEEEGEQIEHESEKKEFMLSVEGFVKK